MSPLPSLDHTQKVRINSGPKWETDKKMQVFYQALCDFWWAVQQALHSSSWNWGSVGWCSLFPEFCGETLHLSIEFGKTTEKDVRRCIYYLFCCFIMFTCKSYPLPSQEMHKSWKHGTSRLLEQQATGQPSQTEILGFQWKYFCLKVFSFQNNKALMKPFPTQLQLPH